MSTSVEDDLLQDLAALSKDPYRYVLWAYPWGEAGTELEKFSGPEPWQVRILQDVRDGLLSFNEAVQEAVASGHGVGKSALVSWLIEWAHNTMEDTRGVVTANTENQLKTKTWAELGKWHRMNIARALFKMTATMYCSRDPEHERTWRIDMVPWSENNTEAFAGLHNKGRRIIVIFDEASAIPDVIWETTEGALTDEDTQILWLVFGNPTRNTGRFKDCFERFKHRWKNYRVDSRTVSITNKTQIDKWIADYGEDSDFVRVRVLGLFPRASMTQFIGVDLVDGAMAREASAFLFDPFIIGVDVARYGGNESVLFYRKGRDGKTHPPDRLRGLDTMALAGYVAEKFLAYRADGLFVDEGGVGAGVVDRLLQLRIPVWGINFGSSADRPVDENEGSYANKRAEMYGFGRKWLKSGSLPNDPDIRAQLIGVEYGFNARNQIQLEKKEDMIKRGLESPDIADAWALTFAYPVAANVNAGHLGAGDKPLVQTEYNPYADERML